MTAPRHRSNPARIAAALAAACGLLIAGPSLARGPDCVLVIPPGGQVEVESPTPTCTHGPAAFQTVLCGTPFRGTSCWDPSIGYRDTDWLKVILTEPGTMT